MEHSAYNYFYPYNIQKRGRGNENAPDLTNLPEVEEGYHLTDQLTDLTLGWLDENYKNKENRKPFFIYLSHYEVHTPFEGKSLLEEKYKIKKENLYRGENVQNEFLYESTTGETKLRQDNNIYAAMIENLDTNFGRVIEYLKENNLYEEILNESREIPEVYTDDKLFCTCFGVDVYERDGELRSEFEYAKTL